MLDALRALALFGVLTVNMMTIAGLSLVTPEQRALAGGVADQLVWAATVVGLQGKALSAFSFLFGLSFSIVIANAVARGEPHTGVFLRRMVLLGLFGLVNAAFFFWGDILTTYAVLGLALPVAARLPRSVLLGLAGVLLIGGPVAMGAAGVAPPPPRRVDQLESLAAFASPDYLDTVRHNLVLFFGAVGEPDELRALRYMLLGGLFLLGLAAGQARLHMRLAEFRHWLVPFGWTLLLLGVALEVALSTRFVWGRVATLLQMDGSMMALGYLALLAVVLQRPGAAALRAALAPLGRMTLTGYLTGGLLGQAVFYGWGLGRIGAAGAAEALAWAAAIFLLLVLFAHLWLAVFRHGPWEWLWRVLSQMRWLPLWRTG
jgi:uncharacterized protein